MNIAWYGILVPLWKESSSYTYRGVHSWCSRRWMTNLFSCWTLEKLSTSFIWITGTVPTLGEHTRLHSLTWLKEREQVLKELNYVVRPHQPWPLSCFPRLRTSQALCKHIPSVRAIDRCTEWTKEIRGKEGVITWYSYCMNSTYLPEVTSCNVEEQMRSLPFSCRVHDKGIPYNWRPYIFSWRC